MKLKKGDYLKEENDMDKNLLIIGAGVYGLVAKEIAESMGCFGKIAFVDDNAKRTPSGIEVIGTVGDIESLSSEYDSFIVAIGNSAVRLKLIQEIEDKTTCRIVSLVSPRAYISPSAQIGKGCIIEPMSVVHTQCELMTGCLVSAGAVVNHASTCSDGVHVDCNATVKGYTVVPEGMKVCSGEVFEQKL